MRSRQRLVAWIIFLSLVSYVGLALLSPLQELDFAVDGTPLPPDIQLGEPRPVWPLNPTGDQPIQLVSSNLSPGHEFWPFYTPPATSAAGEESFSGFAAWIQRHEMSVREPDRQGLAEEGIRLARQRRAALEKLIQSDPRRALELSLSVEQCRKLPSFLHSFLEQPVHGHGDLMVLATLPFPGQEGRVKPLGRVAHINGTRYEAFVYGRRSGEASRTNIPLAGIALGTLLAVEDYSSISQQLSASETEQGMAVAAAALSAGERKLLFIRVDFSDRVGDPFSDSAGRSLITNVNAFYRENSYGKAGFAMAGAGSDITPTLRMPNTAAYYADDELFDELRDDAKAAASAAGYDLMRYDFDLICFGRIRAWNWAGRGYVGGAGVWLNDAFTAGVVAHELGHNFGLGHANFWQTLDFSVLGEQGISKEYGDKFDTMGDSVAGQKHFNARFKNQLRWLPSTNVAMVQNSATFTLWPQDCGENPGIQALNIPRNGRTNYWVEFRQKITGNRWLMAGIGLRWASSDSLSTLLLDATPGSVDGLEDSAVTLGHTFSDYQAGIHITPTAIHPTTPPSIQVIVHRGAFPQNRTPLLELVSSATNLLPGAEAVFEARGADPEAEPLAYAWDMGDGNFGMNQPFITNRWLTSGLYLVRCAVSDMKGGVATDSVLVRVGHPDLWALSGRVLDRGKPVVGIRVSASPSKVTWTDSDGRFILAGLPGGTYNLVAGHEAQLFLHPGFANPLVVRSDLSGLDFLAPALPESSTFTFIPQGAVWKYLDSGEDLHTNWIHPHFDDSAWKEGLAPLGYANPVATPIGYGDRSSSKHITTYFRHAFTANSLNLARLSVRLLRDDGGVVFLNGREIFRSNMPGGVISFNTLASSTVNGSAAESAFHLYEVPPIWLIPGTNLLAVEIHQASPSSSDLAFDLQLNGESALIDPIPRLSWKRAEHRLELAWPADMSGWRLRTALAFDPSASWAPVSTAPAYREGAFYVELPIDGPPQFFILDKPK